LAEVDASPLARVQDLLVVSGEGRARRAATHVIASPSIFGGQLFGLAVIAAAEAAGEEFVPVSMHAQLLDRGIAGSDIEIEVSTVRDGRSSRHRSLVMTQDGRPIAAMQVALGLPSAEGTHFPRSATPPVPSAPSDDSDDVSPFVSRWGFDQLDVVHVGTARTHPIWIRPRLEIPDDPILHAAAIAFVSDMGLVMAAHEAGEGTTAVPLTVDHAIWFHGSPRFDDWTLLDAELRARHGDHGLVSASLTDIGGTLLASMSQGVGYRRARPKPTV
jgi:acyl-CoA thioesterase II